jgi:hypothetical protein
MLIEFMVVEVTTKSLGAAGGCGSATSMLTPAVLVLSPLCA